ncbi:MAG TPA: hypothetical protein VK308_07010 [Pyrinomonadaceae bacterium]|nr:hypothetical protein [Pyrinomonadaceae bacterium]
MAPAYSRVRIVIAPASSETSSVRAAHTSFAAGATLFSAYSVHERPPIFLRRKFKARISRDSVVTDAEMSCSLNSLSRKSSSVMSGVARTVFNIHLRFFSDRRFGFPPRCPTGAIVPVVRFRRNNFLIKLCLKSRGFCPRESHLRDGERLSRLLAIQTSAFCWSLASGKIVCQRKSLKLKNTKEEKNQCFEQALIIYDDS